MIDTVILKKMKANDGLSSNEQVYLHANLEKFTGLCEITGIDISPYLLAEEINPITITEYQQQCSSIYDQAKENKTETTRSVLVKGIFQEYQRKTYRGSYVKRHYISIVDGYAIERIEVDIAAPNIVDNLSKLENSLSPVHVTLKVIVRVYEYNGNWHCKQLCASINLSPTTTLDPPETNEMLYRAPWLAALVGKRKASTYVVLDSNRELLSKISKVSESSSLCQCVDAQSPDKLVWMKRRQYTWLAGPALLKSTVYIRHKQGASLPLLADLASGSLSTHFGQIKPDVAWIILSSRPEQLKHADAFIQPEDIPNEDDLRILLEGRLDEFTNEQKVWMRISLKRKDIEERTRAPLPELYDCFKGYPPTIQEGLVTASGFDAEVVADYVYLVSTVKGVNATPIPPDSLIDISEKCREILLRNDLLCEIDGSWYIVPPEGEPK